MNSLSLRWTAPTNPGSAISDYDVQYREAGGSFTDWPHTGTSTTTTITGLTANTRYEVQVRARNAQGESNWSPSGSGTTNSSGGSGGSGNNPDLIVESPTVSESSPKAGASFTLSATVRNQGGSRSASTTLRYYLSTDVTINTNDQEVDTDYVSRLAPSETSDESAYLRAPSSDGTYYYGACVEAVTGESDTGNNCSSAVTVTVGSTTPPPTPTPNQSPVFSEGASTTRSIAENTGAGQNIGNPISATDSDGDRLTYSLEGRDASAFTIISGSGQLRTRSGVRYDYE